MNTLESCTIDSPNNKTEECAKFIIDDGSFVYSMVDVMVVDRDYTFSCWIKSETEGNILIRDTTFPTTTDWTYCTHTFTATGTDLQLAFVTEGTYYIYHAQLEIGTKATDWTPAVEDVDEDFEKAKSLIQQLSNQISMLVVDENGSSLMTQTSDGWQFSIGGLQTAVSNAQDGLAELKESVGSTPDAIAILQQAVKDLEETTEYIHIGSYVFNYIVTKDGTTYTKTEEEFDPVNGTLVPDAETTTGELVYSDTTSGETVYYCKIDEPCIELWESDTTFKVLVTNTRILFAEGEAVHTYIDTHGLVTENITVENEMRQGGFVWVTHDGNLGLVWKGVDE